jgi:heat shock protein HslJ
MEPGEGLTRLSIRNHPITKGKNRMSPKHKSFINLIQSCMIAIAILVLGACTPAQPGSGDEPAGEALPESIWYLAEIGPVGNPAPVLPGHLATLEFGADNSAGGSAGCNSVGGKYTVEGDIITFDSLVSTLMACLEPGLMEQEAAYLAALDTGGRLEITNTTLVIVDENGQVLRFTSAPPVIFEDTPTPSEPSATPDPNVLCSIMVETADPVWLHCEISLGSYHVSNSRKLSSPISR